MQQSAGHAVQSAVGLVVGGTLNMDDVAFLLQDHLGVQSLHQGALGALDGDNITRSNG